jgi:hypothetical protein
LWTCPCNSAESCSTSRRRRSQRWPPGDLLCEGKRRMRISERPLMDAVENKVLAWRSWRFCSSNLLDDRLSR